MCAKNLSGCPYIPLAWCGLSCLLLVYTQYHQLESSSLTPFAHWSGSIGLYDSFRDLKAVTPGAPYRCEQVKTALLCPSQIGHASHSTL